MKGLGRSRKEARRRGGEPSDDGRAASQVIGIVGTALVLGALTAGAVLGLPRLEAELSAASARPGKVVFDWPKLATKASGSEAGTWLPGEVRSELEMIADRELSREPDPNSPAGLRRVAEAAAGSGWFDEITSVRREPGGVVRVRGEWRTPTAVVRKDNTDYLIASKGEVLPLAFQRGGSTLVAITGVKSLPPMASGQPVSGSIWPGLDLRAGQELLAMLATRPWRDQVAAIDVSGYTDRKELVIVTRDGGRIIWGGAPSDAIPGQVAADVRLKRLDVLHHKTGAIDARHSVVEVAGPRTLVDESATAQAP
jgi:hypothetical protein